MASLAAYRWADGPVVGACYASPCWWQLISGLASTAATRRPRWFRPIRRSSCRSAPIPARLSTFAARKVLHRRWRCLGLCLDCANLGEAFSDEFLQGLDVSFQEDILPWIGPEAGLAIMDMDAGSGDVAPIILTAGHTQPRQVGCVLGQDPEGAGGRRSDVRRGDLQRRPDCLPGARTTKASLLRPLPRSKGLVMIGSNLEAVHQAIATAGTKGTAKLVDEETYHRVMQRLRGDRLGYLYLSSESMLRDLEDVEASLGVGGVQAAGVSFGLASGGVRFDYAVSVDPKSLTTAQLKGVGSCCQPPPDCRPIAKRYHPVSVGPGPIRDVGHNVRRQRSNARHPGDSRCHQVRDRSRPGRRRARADDGEYALALLPDSFWPVWGRRDALRPDPDRPSCPARGAENQPRHPGRQPG